jgi:hypothetical protein
MSLTIVSKTFSHFTHAAYDLLPSKKDWHNSVQPQAVASDALNLTIKEMPCQAQAVFSKDNFNQGIRISTIFNDLFKNVLSLSIHYGCFSNKSYLLELTKKVSLSLNFSRSFYLNIKSIKNIWNDFLLKSSLINLHNLLVKFYATLKMPVFLHFSLRTPFINKYIIAPILLITPRLDPICNMTLVIAKCKTIYDNMFYLFSHIVFYYQCKRIFRYKNDIKLSRSLFRFIQKKLYVTQKDRQAVIRLVNRTYKKIESKDIDAGVSEHLQEIKPRLIGDSILKIENIKVKEFSKYCIGNGPPKIMGLIHELAIWTNGFSEELIDDATIEKVKEIAEEIIANNKDAIFFKINQSILHFLTNISLTCSTFYPAANLFIIFELIRSSNLISSIYTTYKSLKVSAKEAYREIRAKNIEGILFKSLTTFSLLLNNLALMGLLVLSSSKIFNRIISDMIVVTNKIIQSANASKFVKACLKDTLKEIKAKKSENIIIKSIIAFRSIIYNILITASLMISDKNPLIKTTSKMIEYIDDFIRVYNSNKALRTNLKDTLKEIKAKNGDGIFIASIKTLQSLLNNMSLITMTYIAKARKLIIHTSKISRATKLTSDAYYAIKSPVDRLHIFEVFNKILAEINFHLDSRTTSENEQFDYLSNTVTA